MGISIQFRLASWKPDFPTSFPIEEIAWQHRQRPIQTWRSSSRRISWPIRTWRDQQRVKNESFTTSFIQWLRWYYRFMARIPNFYTNIIFLLIEKLQPASIKYKEPCRKALVSLAWVLPSYVAEVRPNPYTKTLLAIRNKVTNQVNFFKLILIMARIFTVKIQVILYQKWGPKL